jgi:hypothetical protein
VVAVEAGSSHGWVWVGKFVEANGADVGFFFQGGECLAGELNVVVVFFMVGWRRGRLIVLVVFNVPFGTVYFQELLGIIVF